MLEAISWLTNLGKILYARTMKRVFELLSGQGLIFFQFELTQGPQLQRTLWDLVGY